MASRPRGRLFFSPLRDASDAVPARKAILTLPVLLGTPNLPTLPSLPPLPCAGLLNAVICKVPGPWFTTLGNIPASVCTNSIEYGVVLDARPARSSASATKGQMWKWALCVEEGHCRADKTRFIHDTFLCLSLHHWASTG